MSALNKDFRLSPPIPVFLRKVITVNRKEIMLIRCHLWGSEDGVVIKSKKIFFSSSGVNCVKENLLSICYKLQLLDWGWSTRMRLFALKLTSSSLADDDL